VSTGGSGRQGDGWVGKAALVVAVLGLLFGTGWLSGVFDHGHGPTKPSPNTTGRGSPAPLTTVGSAAAFYVDQFQMSAGQATLGAVSASGIKFNHGVKINTVGTSSNAPQTVTFVLPRPISFFRAIVGVDPQSAPGYSGSLGVRVLAGKIVVIDTVVSRGSPACSVDVSLDGARTVELQAYFSSGVPLDVAFGDSRVLGAQDFAGETSAPRCP
jgi:hypothetical protein